MIIILIVIKIISAKPIPECETIDLLAPDIPEEWAESKVIGPFRVWHLIFIGFGLFVGLIVLLCCIFRCRIPRTKQEIEADFIRKNITKAFERHLNRITMDELNKEDSNGSKLLPGKEQSKNFNKSKIKP